MNVVQYFPTFMKICLILVPMFSQDAGCIQPLQWTPLKHTWFLLAIVALKMLKGKKRL